MIFQQLSHMIAFQKAISFYLDEIDDINYSEDIEFEKKLQTLKEDIYTKI